MFVVEVFNFNFRGQPKGDGNIKGGNPDGNQEIVDA